MLSETSELESKKQTVGKEIKTKREGLMTSLKEEMCVKDSKCSPLFFWISSMLKQPRLTKALGWVHCPVPDTLSGMLRAGNASLMVLQKQPKRQGPIWCSIMLHTSQCWDFARQEQPIPCRHVLLAYVLVFLGTMAFCRFPFPWPRTGVEERSPALGG